MIDVFELRGHSSELIAAVEQSVLVLCEVAETGAPRAFVAQILLRDWFGIRTREERVAAMQRLCSHGAVVDVMPPCCARCGKML